MPTLGNGVSSVWSEISGADRRFLAQNLSVGLSSTSKRLESVAKLTLIRWFVLLKCGSWSAERQYQASFILITVTAKLMQSRDNHFRLVVVLKFDAHCHFQAVTRRTLQLRIVWDDSPPPASVNKDSLHVVNVLANRDFMKAWTTHFRRPQSSFFCRNHSVFFLIRFVSDKNNWHVESVILKKKNDRKINQSTVLRATAKSKKVIERRPSS